MSFWKDNPCVPTWSATAIAWWNGAPPKLLSPSPPQRSLAAVAGLNLSKATAEQAQEICEFLGRWFTTSVKARCDLPAPVLAAALAEGRLDMWLVRKADGALVATLGRRWSLDAVIGPARWPRAGIVDYFAVHPAVRQRGVGRWLLGTLQASTARPIPPHFILWERVSIGLGLNMILPLAMGRYWVWQRQGQGQGQGQGQPQANVKRVDEPQAAAAQWRTLTATTFLHSALDPSGSVSIWITPAGTVAIQDLFHRSVPDGRRMAMILAASSPAAVAAFAATSPWPLLLGDREWTSEWSVDSVFQWIGYNVLAGSVTTSYPCFGV